MTRQFAVDQLTVADWALELRPIDEHVMSRYRQNMRSGAVFPPVIVDAKTKEVISGNHRVTAYMNEFGPDCLVEVELRRFKSHADRLALMVSENVTHGHRMDGITRKRFTLALISEGMTTEAVSELFGLPIQSVERWAGETVFVIGKGAQPVKGGLDREYIEKVTTAQYNEHVKRDRGQTLVSMVGQIVRWINNDWVDMSDPVILRSLQELRDVLKGF